MSNPNKIILALLGAAAVGIVAGILLAPEKGGEVRKKIADKASDIASRIGEMISFGKDKMDEAGNAISNKSQNLADEIRTV
ncbi:MAG: YtxH domain-containing protein [Ferruginibacter sp.]